MVRFLKLLAFVAAFGVVSLASAHPGGHFMPAGPPVSEDGMRNRAPEMLAKLVEVGKLDASWKGAALKTLEQKTVGEEGSGWVVSFFNATEKDKAKQTAYLFFTLSGELVGANFKGL